MPSSLVDKLDYKCPCSICSNWFQDFGNATKCFICTGFNGRERLEMVQFSSLLELRNLQVWSLSFTLRVNLVSNLSCVSLVINLLVLCRNSPCYLSGYRKS
ncbi:hypothetical protein SO802_018532 [Lithocarpus litseifolius]|uniref:Uncharacterized protein n=1 Tax=Lithocarpus litseifolius TaxID=425828 RepID=A0AAW2CQB0_9ROSI